jgi:hypothetical protein
MAICLKHTILTYLNNAHMLYLKNYKSDPKTDFIFVLRDPKMGIYVGFKDNRNTFYCTLRYIELCSTSQDIVSYHVGRLLISAFLEYASVFKNANN